jgi:hypothetical protein
MPDANGDLTTTAPAESDAKLLSLTGRIEALRARGVALLTLSDELGRSDPDYARLENRMDGIAAEWIALRIPVADMPARTIDGMRAKVRLAADMMDVSTGGEPTHQESLVMSALRDVLTLTTVHA